MQMNQIISNALYRGSIKGDIQFNTPGSVYLLPCSIHSPSERTFAILDVTLTPSRKRSFWWAMLDIFDATSCRLVGFKCTIDPVSELAFSILLVILFESLLAGQRQFMFRAYTGKGEQNTANILFSGVEKRFMFGWPNFWKKIQQIHHPLLCQLSSHLAPWLSVCQTFFFPGIKLNVIYLLPIGTLPPSTVHTSLLMYATRMELSH